MSDELGVTFKLDRETAIRALWNGLDSQDDVEYLAMLALLEGVLQGQEAEEIVTVFAEETGIYPRQPEEAEP